MFASSCRAFGGERGNGAAGIRGVDFSPRKMAPFHTGARERVVGSLLTRGSPQ